MRQRRTPEFWKEVRVLVERGLSLKKTSLRFGLAYSYLVQKAAWEGWKLCYSGRPRGRDYAEGRRQREQMAREQAQYDALQEELQREASVLVIDVRKAELLTEKVLKQHSVRLKVALSEWAVRTAENLQRSEVRLRDQAAAMLAIKAVGNQLYGWDREPDLKRMKRPGTSYAAAEPAENPTGAVNLALINTTPAQLAEMAKAKANLDDHDDDDTGPSETECNGHGVGPSVVAPEQPPTAHGCPIPEKKVPTQALDCQSALDAPAGHSPDSNPTPGSPAWYKKRLQELDRARVVYVGGPTEYQAYQQMRAQRQLAQENLQTAEMYQDAAMDWGGRGVGWERMGYGIGVGRVR